MHITKVKRDGKLSIVDTVKYHVSPKVPKAKRESLKTIINQRKFAERNARLVNIITR